MDDREEKQPWPHLPKAPISEALIDIRVRLPDDTGIGRLAGFRDQLKENYPNCRERRSVSGRLVLSSTGAPAIEAASGGPDGLLLASPDGTEVVQGRLDGFTFSRLKPYRNWEHLRDQTKSAWDVYRRVVNPSLVTRIAVRYINRLELPLPISGFDEWVSTRAEIASGLPQGVAGFFMKLHIPFDQPPGFANVIQALEVGEYDKTLPLIFDIDAVAPEEFAPADEAIWRRLEDLRRIKNGVFFKSITTKTRGLYE